MDDCVILVKQAYTTDSIGQRVATETKTTVFCSVMSATSAEWRNAAMAGRRADLTVVMPLCNYSDEEIVEWNNVRYTVYRTYVLDFGDSIELHLERRVGT